MRSDTEHLHDAMRTLLEKYSGKQANEIANSRTRQMEALARYAYLKVLTTPEIFDYFQDDESILRFWALPREQLREMWGKRIDLTLE